MRKRQLQVQEHGTCMGNNLQPDQPESPNKEGSIVLLATKINSVNAKNYD